MDTTSEIVHIDVVIPFGGNFDYLNQTVESVTNQNYPYWHLYILDDNTQIAELVSYVKGLDNPKITLTHYRPKLGIKRIFDESISTFENRWGMILGADDVLEKNYLIEMSRAIQEFPKSIMIQPSISIIDSVGKDILPFVDRVKKILKGSLGAGAVSRNRLSKTMLLGNWMYFGASVFNTKFLKENRFNPDFQIAMDYELILRMIEMDSQIVIWPEAKFLYRRHSRSYSNTPKHLDLRFKEEMKIMKNYSKVLYARHQYFASVVARAGITMKIFYLFGKFKISSGNNFV